MADEEFLIYSIAEHAREKGMWAGSIARSSLQLQGLGPDGRVRAIEREHSAALLKCFDEILVNALDHAKARARCRTGRVTVIRVSLSRRGVFSCYNDGPGLPVVLHRKASAAAGRPIYVPEVAFCHFLAGTNLEKDADSVKGGINGVGAKLANVHSSRFDVQTVDAAGRYYRQTCRNRCRVIEEPRRAPTSKQEQKLAGTPHTLIQLLPAYAELGYGSAPGPEDLQDLQSWLALRMRQAVAYAGCRFFLNRERLEGAGARGLSRCYCADGGALSFAYRSGEAPYKGHAWDVCVAPSAGRYTPVGVVNGVACHKGAHLDHLKRLLGNAAAELLRKSTGAKVSLSDVCRHLLLVVVAPLPGADWGGQRKDELMLSRVALTRAKFSVRPAAALKQAAELLAAQVAAGLGQRPRRSAIKVDKYTRARLAGKARAGECALLVAEGDSALTFLRAGLAGHRAGPASFELCGLFSLGGVIVNALREVTRIVANGDRPVLVRSAKLEKNKVLQDLATVLGLDYGCAYTTAAERRKLRYGTIVACVDQDLDGCGKILPLLLVFFFTFWPALLRHGYVRRFLTPVVRVYGGRKKAPPLAEFAYEAEFRAWLARHGLPPGGRVRYYKGLGSHSAAEVRRMFADFPAAQCRMALDAEAPGLFQVYYGPEAAGRRAELRTPVVFPEAAELARQRASRSIPCSLQLRVDAKAYKWDALWRQIPNCIDGLVRARRKVLAAALQRFAQANAETKVFQLGGYTADRMLYHHGDASLNRTIIYMAQDFPGGRLWPFLQGVGQFGSREYGGSDAASPRYIQVRLRAALVGALHPPADRPLLPYVFEEGQRAEPRHYVPVLPMAVLESQSSVSEGWSFQHWARRPDDVLALVRAYVRAEPGLHDWMAALARGGAGNAALRERYPLRPNTRGYRGPVRPGPAGHLVSYGQLSLSQSRGRWVARVTELPMGLSTVQYLGQLARGRLARLVERVDDYGGGNRVDLRLLLRERPEDPLHDLRLWVALKSRLNYVHPDLGVVECKSYHKVVARWLPARRALYEARLEREQALLRLLLQRDLAIQRFAAGGPDLSTAADEAEAGRRLTAAGLPELDNRVLLQPGYRSGAELARAACAPGRASHDYILNLRSRDLLVDARTRRAAAIAGLRAQLLLAEQRLAETPLAGASLWLQEIAAAEAAMQAFAAGSGQAAAE